MMPLPANSPDGTIVSGFSRRAQCSVGQPIGDLMARALQNPDIVSLAAGFVDQQSLPVDLTRQAFHEMMSDPQRARRALQYGTTHGIPALRQQLLRRWAAADQHVGGYDHVELSQLIVTAGSNQLLHLVFDSLVDPGDIVLCASPTYFVALGGLAGLGARAWGVTTDADGMVPAALDEAFKEIDRRGELSRVKALYIVSYFDNPAGTTVSWERRREIMDVLRRWSRRPRIYLIEDAAYRELRYEGDDVPSFRSLDPDGETVVLTSTFSKSYSPGIRIGWGLLPRPLAEVVSQQKDNIDFGTANLNQLLMHTILESGQLDAHIEHLKRLYREKRDAMQEALTEVLAPVVPVRWHCPSGGLYFWLELPAEIDTGTGGPLFDLAVQRGMLYVPGRYFFPTSGADVQHHHVRLSFGVQSPPRIRAGIEAFSTSLQSCWDHADS